MSMMYSIKMQGTPRALASRKKMPTCSGWRKRRLKLLYLPVGRSISTQRVGFTSSARSPSEAAGPILWMMFFESLSSSSSQSGD
ncbi:unnamed protein product [Durusdinium trenchii]|uniref:Uncharacterized protein n=2 Tax=Durusdinium trenchii TaxID=1381693 RepID=A0ABP0P7S5_9DINO